jgi:hypothetical protein
MTTGIQTLCIHKRDLCLYCRNSNNTKLQEHYKLYYYIIIIENHIDQLKFKLSSACYTVRNVKGIMSQETVKMIYFSNVRSITAYGIYIYIFFGGGGNCPTVLIF